MDTTLRRRLIEAARIKKSTICAQYLSDELFLGLKLKHKYDRKIFYNLLCEIAEYEYQHNRPMLSILVTLKRANFRRDCFYKSCKELGIRDENTRDYDFEDQHMNNCYEFWGDEENYRKYKNCERVGTQEVCT
jgi:hypothetical protein